ncbi:class I SAM-dependent DNA methyltransferase [Spirosoma litoris]
MLNKESLNNLAGDIWKGAIKLRGKFKPKDYASVILPMIVIRRIECVLDAGRERIARDIVEKKLKAAKPELTPDELTQNLDKRFEGYGPRGEVDLTDLTLTFDQLRATVKLIEKKQFSFYNETHWTIRAILNNNRTQAETAFREYVGGFAPVVQQIIDKFEFRAVIGKMVQANRLDSIMELVKNLNLSPSLLSNIEMGYVYEELLQRFSQDDAKDTGEHFTPREVIRLMVELLEIDLNGILNNHRSISIYDPACGTGGMLSVAKEHLIDQVKTEAEVKRIQDHVLLYGQELLPQNYAVCLADMLLKGESLTIDTTNIRQPVKQITNGNSLIAEDGKSPEFGDFHQYHRFDYMLSNPPFGVNWGEYGQYVEKLQKDRYKPGLPRDNDGALLFLLSMIEKMNDRVSGGSKIAILFSGSPLSNGDALSGESEIRRYILENDLLDTVVMLPDQLFYSTGIYTYIWLLNNAKPAGKDKKVTIINARKQFEKEPKSFGNKRHRISDAHRAAIMADFRANKESDTVKTFRTTDFAFHKVSVTYWLQDEDGTPLYRTEAFESLPTNAVIKRVWETFGDLAFSVTLDNTTLTFTYDNTKAFDAQLADVALKAKLPAIQTLSVKELKTWLKRVPLTGTYTHRHYVPDTEYIPFDADAPDRAVYIQAFLEREIEYPIVRWEEARHLGYEILPNKYFYCYQEPTPSDQLLDEFWKLEAEAEEILTQIRTEETV